MIRYLLVIFLLIPTYSFAQEFKLDKYLGLWHEIYSIPNRFQKDCYNVTAEYSLKDNNNIKVVNTCRDESGKVKKISEGEAIVKSIKERYLKVYFFRPLNINVFGGEYRILDLGKNYQWAIVGTKDRDYGWILARKNKLSDSELKIIKSKVESLGYDWSKFNHTVR